MFVSNFGSCLSLSLSLSEFRFFMLCVSVRLCSRLQFRLLLVSFVMCCLRFVPVCFSVREVLPVAVLFSSTILLVLFCKFRAVPLLFVYQCISRMFCFCLALSGLALPCLALP